MNSFEMGEVRNKSLKISDLLKRFDKLIKSKLQKAQIMNKKFIPSL